MRTLACCFFLLLVSLQQASAVNCPPHDELVGKTWLDTDQRDVRTFNRVVQLARLSDADKPLLCAANNPLTGPSPMIFKADSADDRFILLLPRIVHKFSDIGLTGVIGHEIGHLFEDAPDDAAISSNALEERVDARAAGWVGKSTVRQALKEAITYLLPLYPRSMRKIYLPRLKERIELLE